MCGIAGLANYECDGVARRAAVMLRELIHRGPDADGISTGAGWAIGARRLAIIDLETGGQPVANEDGTVHAVLNGEIYNFQELRAELIKRGHRLHSRGDTEVLVHLWEDDGPALVSRLRGMFALAIVDERRRTLFLARDRVGKKPLYWARVGAGLAFASELKALRPALAATPALDRAALASFLRWGFVPEGECILAGCAKLPPAHALTFDLASGAVAIEPYWRLEFAPDPGLDLTRAAERLVAELDVAVRLRLVADVPIAIFLSGGLDSGLIATLARRHVPELRALTVSFGADPGELPLARATAESAGIEIEPIVVDPAAGLGTLTELATVFDEPLADPSVVPTLLVARAARRYATVVLNGDGGDEVLAGYRRFLAARVADIGGRSGLRTVAAGVTFAGIGRAGWSQWGTRLRRAAGAADLYDELGPVKFTVGEVAALTGTAPGRLDPVTGSEVARMQQRDFGFFLPGDLLVKMDRATMAASLESRSPLLDHCLIEAMARVPPNVLLHGWRTKAVTRRAATGLLPAEVGRAGKRGFEAPLEAWLDGGWSGEVATVLEDPAATLRQVLDPAGLAPHRAWRQAGDRQRAARALFTLITLEHWLRRWGSGTITT